MGNIVEGNIDLEKLKYLPADHEEFPVLLLNRGDVLFNRIIVQNSLEKRPSITAPQPGVRLRHI